MKREYTYDRKTETEFPAAGVRAEVVIEIIDGEEGEAFVNLEGGFTLPAKRRQSFLKALGELITQYRV